MNCKKESKKSKEMNDRDDEMEEENVNTRKDKRSKIKQEKREKICSFCHEPPTRHDLCNRCRQKVESRSIRKVAQKFENCCQCGCAFAAYLRGCENFGLEPAKLTFFTTLALMDEIYPIWHLRHESDQLFMDERGTVNSRWNLPDSHIEKVFVNLYKKMKENPILDGKECDANRRFSRSEINRILEQKLEQKLKDFGKLHQFSFSGNAYCSNENDNNNNDNNDNNGNNSNNTNEKPTINRQNEEGSNMESNPQSRQSNSRSRSRNNSNNSNDNSEGAQSFVGQYSNNNNDNDMSNNIIGENGRMNAFSFDLSMPPQAPRIGHAVSNESYLMGWTNMNGERGVAGGAAGVGLSSSTPVSPMVAGQGRRFSRMAIARVALPCLPQEAPMLWNANFQEFVGFAQSSASNNNDINGNNGNNSSGNNSNDGNNVNVNSNNNNNLNNVGSMTPRLMAQMDGNVTDHGYMSSNDESYDTYDSSDNNQANGNGNVSNVCNVIDGSNINENNACDMVGYENFDDMIPHFSLNENDNESFGSGQMNWNSNDFYHNYNYNMASSSVLNFNENESVANFGGSDHDNWENGSIISALPMASMASMTSVPLQYDRVRGRGIDASLMNNNNSNNNNNNNNNRLWNSSLAPIEELRNRFHDLGDNDLI